MAYFIEQRSGKWGITYRAQVMIKNEVRIVYRDVKSFAARREAIAWGARRD